MIIVSAYLQATSMKIILKCVCIFTDYIYENLFEMYLLVYRLLYENDFNDILVACTESHSIITSSGVPILPVVTFLCITNTIIFVLKLNGPNFR
jgi:hypothetical protein